MVITLSPEIKQEVVDILGRYGYKTENDFVEDALRHRILELKKRDFLLGIKKIRDRMIKKGLKREYILRDFDEFYHK